MVRLNPHILHMRCSLSGETSAFERRLGLCRCCPAPGKPLLFEYNLGDRSPVARGGMWRYEARLPVWDVAHDYASDVGGTGVQLHERLSEELGLPVWLKNESGNPTGSFKDRGLAMAAILAKVCGATGVCLPTQGNAGVAAACFAKRAGLSKCVVYMPEHYVDSFYHRGARYFGAEVHFEGANIAAAGKKMRTDLAAPLADGSLIDFSTFFEPGRLEGKKTLGLEIAEDMEELPDAIFYPTGGGTGLVGISKGMTELGISVPRLVAVQSSQCAPVVNAFRAGADSVAPVESLGTVADGLDVPAAIMGHEMLRVLRDSSGDAIAVSEEDIHAAFVRLGELGVSAGYEAAATLAALRSKRGDYRSALLLVTSGYFAGAAAG